MKKKTLFEEAGYDRNTRFVVTRDIKGIYGIAFKKGDLIRYNRGKDEWPEFVCGKTGKKYLLDFKWRIRNGDIQEEEIYKRRLEMQKKQDFWYIGNGQVVFEEPVKNKMVKDDVIPEAPDFTSKKHLWDF